MPPKCKDARKAYNKEYSERPGVKEKKRENFKRYAAENQPRLRHREAERRLNKRAMVMVASTRTRARKRGFDFDLDQYIPELQSRVDAGFCEVTGQPFDLSSGRKFNSPSFDRVDCSRGYTYDNVRVVLNLVNVALGDWGEDVLRSVMTKWLHGTEQTT